MSQPADNTAGAAPAPRYVDRDRHVRVFVDVALAAADPARALEAHWPPSLGEARRRLVVGAGKAALGMALKLDELCEGDLAGGAVAVVPERLERLDALPTSFDAYPTSHPLPDERNVEAARSIARVAREAGEGDTLIALISGGGSAMLTLPAGDLTLDDLRAVTDALQKAGASIAELNAVRKHCEQLKGGGLARLAHPAEVWAFILSDVVGDPLDVIASGPTAPDPTTYDEALAVLDAYDLRGAAPAVTAHLEAGARGEHPETVKPGDPVLGRVTNRLIGSNRIALEAVRGHAEASGWRVAGFEVGVEGEARLVGAQLAMLAQDIHQRADRPACYLMGGETTVTVSGQGRGGRNQELALAAAIELDGAEGIAVASIATDGVDGPTDAAGALVTGGTCASARAQGLDPSDYLDRNDSYRFFEQVGGLIRSGPTGTNVNDLMMAFVY
jgi:glycerate 2-kinase